MIKELKERREYINNPQKAINRHSIRFYTHSECYSISTFEDGTQVRTDSVFVLDRNLSTIPSYFQYCVLDSNGRVFYSENLPNEVTSWKQAEKWLENLKD